MRIGIHQCIFCGSGDLCAEHLFPKWSRALVRTRYKKVKHTLREFGRPSSGFLTKKIHPGDLKLTIVCKTCNNGWMSKLQKRVLPALTKIIIGGSTTDISDIEGEALASWCVMSAMIFEYTNPDLVSTAAGIHRIFFYSQAVPKRWRVWIGRSPTHEAPSFHVSSGGIHEKEFLQIVPDASANCFTASWVIGSLFVHVFGRASDLDTDPIADYDVPGMLELPIKIRDKTAVVPLISEEAFAAVALSLEERLLDRLLPCRE